MSQQIRADVEAVLHRRVKSIEPIPEGHSGFTYFIDGDYVLRLPPPGARIAGPADVVRQGRIMSALRSVGLPTPAIPLMSSDAAIDGRPFILMERVDGVRIEETARRENPLDIATSAVNVLKRMQALPIEKTGIGDEEPVGLREEMMRWAMLMQRAPEELTTRAGELGGLLAAHIPTERAPTLVHGDYHYGNMLFRGAEVVAVLDWEIAELGQPLLDLGCLCSMTVRRRFADAPSPGGAVAIEMEELFDLYGVNADEMGWYVALSLYKYAAILGYNLMLHRKGRRPDPMYEGLTGTIVGMIDEGITLL
ncbi:MAG: phosphotransferase family protein [Chloroflexi bacterium]|nr:MAG: phosphotransferase family protein [Chloroflexota bacterium]